MKIFVPHSYTLHRCDGQTDNRCEDNEVGPECCLSILPFHYHSRNLSITCSLEILSHI